MLNIPAPRFPFLLVAAFLLAFPKCGRGQDALPTGLKIVRPVEASYQEALAAREIRRYLYLRTGALLPIASGSAAAAAPAILVGNKDRWTAVGLDAAVGTVLNGLQPQQYLIRTLGAATARMDVVSGGDGEGTLYAAYRYCEKLGVRFYLEGDVVPDAKLASWPAVDETAAPLFALRGIQPFHDFPEGPDWWTTDDYQAIIGQLPKLRMNFIGLHTYPEKGPTAEPTVWIGLPGDYGPDGKVSWGYPASYASTMRDSWGYRPKKTSDYGFGASQLFDKDAYGSEAQGGMLPWPGAPGQTAQQNQRDYSAVFNNTADMLKTAFTFAHKLGVKTCVGTEGPLTIPGEVGARMAQQTGKTRADLYEGIFGRIAKAYPLDYYWIWTPEGWTWGGATLVPETQNDFAIALTALAKINAPFKLASCGWVLGPENNRALFDGILPKDVPMSAINRNTGNTPLDSAFGKLSAGRPRWAIPWLEDDPGLTAPQLWAGRMRRDAVDARKYGCTGLMGIHWRTREVGPNVSALAQLGWSQEQWTTDAFYLDWATQSFGAEVGTAAGKIFAALDGKTPRPVLWTTGPGSLGSGGDYAFVALLENMRSRVVGKGNLARFDYWLNDFRYLRAVGGLKADKNLLADVYKYLLAKVGNTGELGTVMNWENHVLMDAGPEGLKTQWPPGSSPMAYQGEPRILVPTLRGSMEPGEVLSLKVILLDKGSPTQTDLYWRTMGGGEEFRKIPLIHVARGVYKAQLPQAGDADLEYYVKAVASTGKELYYPPTAPEMNQTVVSASLAAPVSLASPSQAASARVGEILGPVTGRFPLAIRMRLFRESRVTLKVTSPAGREVWRRDLGLLNPGITNVTWGGTDAGGRGMPQGLYLGECIWTSPQTGAASRHSFRILASP